MPRVLGYNPSWLSRKVFASLTDTAAESPSSSINRLLARRGSQIFVVVDNEIRWADLTYLKDYEAANASRRTTPSDSSYPDSLFRVIKVPVREKITQLSVSPEGDFLAIITKHTIHVALLRDDDFVDIGPLKLNTHLLGPSTRNLSDAPAIVCSLWHPLGFRGRCFVTIHDDSTLRLWELDPENRSSFSDSSLSIDLTRLLDAEDETENLSASEHQSGKAFTPDAAYMEPVAACFAGIGRKEENPWSSMTLWIAMADGSLYALCPLIPSRFRVFSGQLPSFDIEFRVKERERADEPSRSGDQHAESGLQREKAWLESLRAQEPYISNSSTTPAHIFRRPTVNGAIPKLQGPFGADITDVVDMMFNDSELLSREYSCPLLCLMTKAAKLHIFLGVDDLKPRWLSSAHNTDPLLLLGSFNVLSTTSETSPVFTRDAKAHDTLFITHSLGVSSISMKPMIELIQAELDNSSRNGADFRANLFLGSVKPTIKQVLKFEQHQINTNILACVVIYSTDIGYLVLTSLNNHPHAVLLDDEQGNIMQESIDEHHSERIYDNHLQGEILRPSYEANNTFYSPSRSSSFVRELGLQFPVLLHENIHLTAETLSAFMRAHQLFATECEAITTSVAELHIAADRMQLDFSDQLFSIRESAARVDGFMSYSEEEEGEEGSGARGRGVIEKQIVKAHQRLHALTSGYNKLRDKVTGQTKQPLSGQEKRLLQEIGTMEELFDHADSSLPQRMLEVKRLCDGISSDYTKYAENSSASITEHQNHVPAGIRKSKVDKVMELLERQNAMVESTTERISKLQLSVDRPVAS